jgi:hypothetical protein
MLQTPKEAEMPKVDTWLRRLAGVAAVLMLLLQAQAMLAQDTPPAKAPTPPGNEEMKPPDLPAAAGDRKARLEALRERWQEMAANPRGGIQMAVQGEYVYILFGTTLCQLSAETLELKAKVDLRQLIFGDKALGKLRGDRPAKKPKPEAEEQ